MENVEAIKQLEKIKGLRSLLPKSKEAIDAAIDSLHTQWSVKQQTEIDEHKDEMLRVLFNRCMAISGLCMWCGLKEDCYKYRTVLKGE